MQLREERGKGVPLFPLDWTLVLTSSCGWMKRFFNKESVSLSPANDLYRNVVKRSW